MLRNKLIVGLILGLLSFSAAAQQKIGTVDIQKAFDGYYKTKIADKQLKADGKGFEDTLKSMYEDYEKLSADHLRLREEANDQIISADERERRKTQADAKLREVQEKEANIKEYDRSAKATLAEKQRRLRENVLRDINDLVAQKAKAAGYTIILDTAALSRNDTKIVVYTDGASDMTKDIIAALNADAPAEYKTAE